jgi:DNA-binding NarL/FixJ family response regulator
VAGEAEDGQKAVEYAKLLHPDVMLMDVNMPRMNGIEATRIIHRDLPEIRFVGLSMHDSLDAGRAMLEAGAVSYLPKDSPVEDLLAAIQNI